MNGLNLKYYVLFKNILKNNCKLKLFELPIVQSKNIYILEINFSITKY